VRIGVIGDIHSNFTALKAVLQALDDVGVDTICCVGDVVGYGPHPNQCVELLRQRQIPCVKGNHDEYATQGRREWLIRPEARVAIEWTQDVLTDDHKQWLRQLPRAIWLEDIELLHSSHALYPSWRYVFNEETAMENFLLQSAEVCFNAHTHLPLFAWHQPGSKPHISVLENMFLPRERSVLIGVGSVGQPRDGDPRSAAVIYNSKTKSVSLRRIAYDVSLTQADITKAKLPAFLATRLGRGV